MRAVGRRWRHRSADGAGAVLPASWRACAHQPRIADEFVDPRPGSGWWGTLHPPAKIPNRRDRTRGSNSGGGGGAEREAPFRRPAFSPRAFRGREKGLVEGPAPSDPDELPNASTSPNIRRTISFAFRRRHRARVAAQVRPSEGTRGPFFYITTHENVQRPIIKMTVLASRVECQVFGAPRHLAVQHLAPRGRADAGGVSPGLSPRVRHRAPRLSRHRLGSARGGRRHRVRRGAARRARAGP